MPTWSSSAKDTAVWRGLPARGSSLLQSAPARPSNGRALSANPTALPDIRSPGEDEAGVVGGADAVRLIAVAEDADALQLGNFGIGIAVEEVLAEERFGIDLLFAP